MAINAIGEKVLLTSGSMTAAANRLEKKGLIERMRNPSDGRCFYLHLTKPGTTLIRRVFDRHSKNLDTLFGVLDPTEQEEFVRLLKKVGKHASLIKVG